MKNTMVKNELFHKGEIFTVGNGERNMYFRIWYEIHNILP